MYAVLAPTAVIHRWTALATNSGPLSERMWPGTPRRINESESTSMTSIALRAIHADGQALVRELVDDVEQAELAAIVGALLDEVVGPDVVAVLEPQPNAGPVREHSHPRLGCFWGTLSPSLRQIRSTLFSF